MKKKILEIIEKIHNKKKAANKEPDFVTEKEIRTELYHQITIDLQLLVDDGILKKGSTINDFHYQKK